jgi:alpha-beta hydrolase superfamily lysophospholipase
MDAPGVAANAMTDSPILLRTSAGVISAMLTTPDREPVATVVVVQGWSGTRAGANRIWPLLATDLARDGIATLRTDYAGMGESWDARVSARVAGVRELVQSYRDSRPGTPLLFVAHCFGLTPALAVCRVQDGVIGAAVVIPPIWPEAPSSTAPLGRRLVRKVRGRLGALRRLPVRTAYALRYGAGAVRMGQLRHDHEEVEGREELTELVRRVPTWMLVGEHDLCLAPTQQLLPELREVGDVELETVDGLVLRAATPADAQAAIRSRVGAWARRVVAQHPASPYR